LTVQIFVEGGGDTAETRKQCRTAFASLLQKLNLAAQPRIVACGSRGRALDQFRNAQGPALVLVDSERANEHHEPAWKILEKEGLWTGCIGREASVFLMVQCMESWFLADHETTAAILSVDGRKLKGNPRIEEIPKRDVLTRLAASGYSKRRHSWQILARVDPLKVRAASNHAEQFFTHLEERHP
jgi:hypothetical protein